jgi:hypothetical protein
MGNTTTATGVTSTTSPNSTKNGTSSTSGGNATRNQTATSGAKEVQQFSIAVVIAGAMSHLIL